VFGNDDSPNLIDKKQLVTSRQNYFVLVLALGGVVHYYNTKSPKYLDDGSSKEIHMSTSLSTKFTALALALVVNGMIMGGVAYLFNERVTQDSALSVSGDSIPGVTVVA
jgi:hypothetical protein